MGVDYVIDLDCAPKQALGTESIVELVKARSRADAVLAMARSGGDQRPPSQIKFAIAVSRNGKIEQTEVAPTARMRAQGETFFRLRQPPVRTWPGRLTITGDQLFHMLFHVGHLQPSHAKMLCLFFGMMSLDDDGPPRRAGQVPLESANARQMLAFVNTLAVVAQNEVDLLIDT